MKLYLPRRDFTTDRGQHRQNVDALVRFAETLPLLVGEGDPTGVVDAPIGWLYSRTDGGAGTTLYAKEGPDATDWSAK